MAWFQRTPDLKKLMAREDVQGLLQALRKAGDDARAEIIQILGEIRDPRATEALIRESEQSGDLTIRRLAAETLKKVDPERKYLAALHLLNDVHRSVRTAAASLLAATGNPKALDALLDTLKKDSDPQARAAAAHAVASLHDRRALPSLLAALTDGDDRVRVAAANGLATLGDRTALDALMQLHGDDPHPDVRDAAGRAIARLQAPAS